MLTELRAPFADSSLDRRTLGLGRRGANRPPRRLRRSAAAAAAAAALALSACEDLNQAATVAALSAGGVALWGDDGAPASGEKRIDLTVASSVEAVAGSTGTGEVRVYAEDRLLRVLGIGTQQLFHDAHQRIRLIAVATAGHLASWHGTPCSGSGSSASCTVLDAGSFEVTAVFGPPVRMSLDVQGDGMLRAADAFAGDIAEGADEEVELAEGGRITLEAVPSPGASVFFEWAGGLCRGGLPRCVVIAVDGGRVDARFRAGALLSVAAEGPGAVAVSWTDRDDVVRRRQVSAGAPLAETLSVGVEVALEAVADAGQMIVWQGDCAENAAAAASRGCELVMSANRDVSAVFGAARTLTLAFEPEDGLAGEDLVDAPPGESVRQLRWRVQGAPGCETIGPSEASAQGLPLGLAAGARVEVFVDNGHHSDFDGWRGVAGGRCARASPATLPPSCQRASASCVLDVADSTSLRDNALAARFVAAVRVGLALAGTGTISVRTGAQSLLSTSEESVLLRVRQFARLSLSATPAGDSRFGLWLGELSDAGVYGDPSCVDVSASPTCAFDAGAADTALTAVFVPATDLALSVGGGGGAVFRFEPVRYDVVLPDGAVRVRAGRTERVESVVRADGSTLRVSWPSGVDATVVAEADPDSVFVRWRSQTVCLGGAADAQRMPDCRVAVASSDTALVAELVPARQLSVLLAGAEDADPLPQITVQVDQPQWPDEDADFEVDIRRNLVWPQLADGSGITLSAVPGEDAHFVGWSGDGTAAGAVAGCPANDPTATVCAFTLGSDSQVVGNFAASLELALTVTQLAAERSAGSVSVASAPPRLAELQDRFAVANAPHRISMPALATVRLAPDPGPINLFVGWDRCPGERLDDGVCEFLMTQPEPKVAVAEFEVPRRLDLAIAGAPHAAAGSAAGEIGVSGPLQVVPGSSDGPGRYAKIGLSESERVATLWTRAVQFNDSSVTLSARPVEGAVFTGWNLDPAPESAALSGDGLDCVAIVGDACRLSLALANELSTLTATFEFIREVDLEIAAEADASDAQLEVNATRLELGADGEARSIASDSLVVGETTRVLVVGHRAFSVVAAAGENAFFSRWEREAEDGAVEGSCLPTDPVSMCDYGILDAALNLRARFRALAMLSVAVRGDPSNRVVASGGARIVVAGDGTVQDAVMTIYGGADATLRVAAGELVRLEPMSSDPDRFRFIGWEGVCAGADACALTLDAASSATAVAVFETLRTVRLRMSAGGLLDVSGSHRRQYVGPLDLTFLAPDGEPLRFEVLSSTGSETHFAWEGVCAPVNVTGTVTVNPSSQLPVGVVVDGSVCGLTVGQALLDERGELPVGIAFGAASPLSVALQAPAAASPTPTITVEVDGLLFDGPLARLPADSAERIGVLPESAVTLRVLTSELGGLDLPDAIAERLFRWRGMFCEDSSERVCEFEMPATSTPVAIVLEYRPPVRIPLRLSAERFGSAGALVWQVTGKDGAELHAGELRASAGALASTGVDVAGELIALSDSTMSLRVELAVDSDPAWNEPPAPRAFGLPTIGDCRSVSTRLCAVLLSADARFDALDARELRVTLPGPIQIPLTLAADQYGVGGRLAWNVQAPTLVDSRAEREGALEVTPTEALAGLSVSATVQVSLGSTLTLRVELAPPGSTERPEWNEPPAPRAFGLRTIGDCDSRQSVLCVIVVGDSTAAAVLDERALRVDLPTAAFRLGVVTGPNVRIEVETMPSTPLVSLAADRANLIPSSSRSFAFEPMSLVRLAPQLPDGAGTFRRWRIDGDPETVAYIESACPLRQPDCEFVAPFGGGATTLTLTLDNTALYYAEIVTSPTVCTGSAVGAMPAFSSSRELSGGNFEVFHFGCASRWNRPGSYHPVMILQVRSFPVGLSDADLEWSWSDSDSSRCDRDRTSGITFCDLTQGSRGPYNFAVSALLGAGALANDPPLDYGDDGVEALFVARQGAGSVRVYGRAERTEGISDEFFQPSPDLDDWLNPLALAGNLSHHSSSASVVVDVPTDGVVTMVADISEAQEDLADFDVEFLRWDWPGTPCDGLSRNPCSVDFKDIGAPVGSTVTAVFSAPMAQLAQRGPGAVSLAPSAAVATPYVPGAFLGWEGCENVLVDTPAESRCDLGNTFPDQTITAVFHPFWGFGVKRLAFGLGYPMAERTRTYQVSLSPAPTEDFRLVTGRVPANVVVPGAAGPSLSLTLPVHLGASRYHYLVDACEGFSCMEVTSDPSQRDLTREAANAAIGYFKAPNADADDRFGRSVALSADGDTLAVGAPFEDAAAGATTTSDFIAYPSDPDWTAFLDSNGASDSGAVYVYRRDASGSWAVEALVKSPGADANDQFGASVALSADGDALAVGAPFEDGGESFVPDTLFPFRPSDPGFVVAVAHNLAVDQGTLEFDAGAVFVYRRNPGWELEAYVKSPWNGLDDNFGAAVALSADGDTLAVGVPFEDGESVAASGTSDALGFVIVPTDPHWGSTLSNDNATNAGAVHVYRFAEMSTGGVTTSRWMIEALFKSGVVNGAEDRFGSSVALSGIVGFASDERLAVGAPLEDSGVAGGAHYPMDAIWGDALSDDSVFNAGAVYTYRRHATFGDGFWAIEAFLKHARLIPGNSDRFGEAVALSADGTALAVGLPGDDSGQAGAANGVAAIVSAIGSGNVPESGAVLMYRFGGVLWVPRAFFKPPASLLDSPASVRFRFGASVALSADGATLAVTAPDLGGGEGVTGVYGADDSDHDAALVAAGASTGAGVVHVYQVDGPDLDADSWQYVSFVRAPNAGPTAASFGNEGALALSADGETLAIGSRLESGLESASPTTNPPAADCRDPCSVSSGAVYLY